MSLQGRNVLVGFEEQQEGALNGVWWEIKSER